MKIWILDLLMGRLARVVGKSRPKNIIFWHFPGPWPFPSWPTIRMTKFAVNVLYFWKSPYLVRTRELDETRSIVSCFEISVVPFAFYNKVLDNQRAPVITEQWFLTGSQGMSKVFSFNHVTVSQDIGPQARAASSVSLQNFADKHMVNLETSSAIDTGWSFPELRGWSKAPVVEEKVWPK